MIKTLPILIASACYALPAFARTPPQDVEALEARIAESWRKHESLTAKVVETQKPPGDSRTELSNGQLQLSKTGDQILSRLDTEERRSPARGETEQTATPLHHTFIDDGVHRYLYVEEAGTAAKWLNRGGQDPRQQLEVLRRQYELRLTEEDDLDGQEAIVVEATAKPDCAMHARGLLYDRPDGICIKEVWYDEAGEPRRTRLLKDIEWDVDIDPDRFVLTLPEGVELKELRQGQGLPVTSPD